MSKEPREFWIDDSHPDEKVIMQSPDNWEMHCWSKPIHVREVHPLQDQEDTFYLRKIDTLISEINTLTAKVKRYEEILNEHKIMDR